MTASTWIYLAGALGFVDGWLTSWWVASRVQRRRKENA